MIIEAARMPRVSVALIGVPSGERDHDANNNSKSLDDREWRFEYRLPRVGPVVVNRDHLADDIPAALPVHQISARAQPSPSPLAIAILCLPCNHSLDDGAVCRSTVCLPRGKLRLCRGAVLELFGEADEKSFGAADVAEPVRLLILNHVADELRASLAELVERLVDVVHSEHDA